jgi:polygalacturonase
MKILSYRAFGLLLLVSTSAGLVLAQTPESAASRRGIYDVMDFGAKGDGTTLDSDAINKAIDAANAAGGGTVRIPAGAYLSVSIRLKSNVALLLEHGAVLEAADPRQGYKYDPPEPNEFDQFQDFGHTHWRNSLIWGEDLSNVSIIGTGMIYGKGLVSGGGGSRTREQNDALQRGQAPAGRERGPFGYPDARDAVEPGWGNKAIALKNCRNVVIEDITIYRGGHFALLATEVDNLHIDNVKVDTNRDGFDIDACRNVRVSNCVVNSPSDDAICLKSSYGLGHAQACENITITNCQVSGYDIGTYLDGTFKRSRGGATGRIKFGTESNGGFKNITISNCVFDFCRGLALEVVDGGVLEDVSISNLTMRDITNSAIYVRLGNRARGPEGTPVSTLRRVSISNVIASNVNHRHSSIIAGIPGHPIEDLTLSNIRIQYRGGGTKEDAAIDPPELETEYPEPGRHGTMPAYGFFIDHVKNLTMSHIDLSFIDDDARPAFVLTDVAGATFEYVKAKRIPDVPFFVLRGVTDFTARYCGNLPEIRKETVADESF